MKDSTNEKRPYEAPLLTVVSFKVERGFAGSGPLGLSLAWSSNDEDPWSNGGSSGGSRFGGGWTDNGGSAWE